MPYTRLCLLVEGPDDKRFVERVMIPAVGPHYDFVQMYEYSQKKADKVNAFLQSIRAMGADYFLLCDLNAYQCFPKKKQALMESFRNLDARQTHIAVKEIESWYLAGLTGNNPLAVC